MKNIYFYQISKWLKKNKLFLALFFLCFSMAIGTLIYLFHFATSSASFIPCFSNLMQEGWETYIRKDGKKIILESSDSDALTLFSEDPYQTYYVSHILTSINTEKIFRINRNLHNICVFLNEEVLYSDSLDENVQLETVTFPAPTHVSGSSYVYIQVSPDDIGKTLTIAQNQHDILVSGIIPCEVSLSSDTASLLHPASSFMRSAFVISLMTLAAIAAIFFFLLECYQGYYDWSTLLFSFSALLWMTEYSLSLSQMSILDMTSKGARYIFYRYFYIIPLLAFFCLKVQIYKKLYIALIGFLIIAMATAWVIGFPAFLLSFISTVTFAILLFTFFVLYLQKKEENHFAKHFFVFVKYCSLILFAFLCGIYLLKKEVLFKFFQEFIHDIKCGDFTSYNRTIAIFFLIFLTYETFMSIYRHMLRRKLAIQSLELKQQHSSENLLHLKSYLRQTSMIRHDMRHHFSVLQYYLEKKEIENASSYLNELIHQESEIVPYVHTSNDLINILLNSWLLTIKEKNINVTFSNLSAPMKVPVSAPDICSLLTNMLRNSEEACEKAPAGVKPFLILEMYVKKDFFLICCKNSYYENLKRDKHGHFITTKKDPDHHGFGIYIIEKITEKYDGLLHIETDDNTFSCMVALRIASTKDIP